MVPPARRFLQAYRLDDHYSLVPGSGEGTVPALVELRFGVRPLYTAGGILRLFHPHYPFGMSLPSALELGWCILAESLPPDAEVVVPPSPDDSSESEA